MASIQLVKQQCPLCDSSESSPVCQIQDATYGVEGTFNVVRCRGCRHVFLDPRPSNASLMACYPTDYAPHIGASKDRRPPSCGEEEQPTAVQDRDCEAALLSEASHVAGLKTEQQSETESGGRSLLRRVLRRIPGLVPFLNWLGQENATWLPAPPQAKESKLLEIGCAHGAFLTQAQELGWVVDGIEPNPEAASRAVDKGLEVSCGFLEESIDRLGPRDCVAMWMVLEHVPNPRETLQMIASILRPGGALLLSVPNITTWERVVFGKYWLGYDAPRHLQMFSSKRLRKLLHDEGFEQVRVIHQSNTRYWWGSLAAWGAKKFPNHQWPRRWMDYFRSEPPASWRWLVLPGKLNAVCRLSGRITVVAQRAQHEPRQRASTE